MPRELLKRALPKLRHLQFANDSAVERLNALIEDIETELAKPCEPDYWHQIGTHECWPADELPSDWRGDIIPLYTCPPPQREPLSKDAIKACLQDAVRLPPGWLDFARAIERAHGIGGEK